MSYIGQGLPADVFAGFTIDKFTGDGTANKALTLSEAPFNETAVLVTIDGVVQEPTDDFTVSGTTLTLVGTAANGSEINVTHLSGPVQVTQAASLDLNGASDKLILDADADTTISADTDDQIDFKVGGTDQIKLTDGVLAPTTTNDVDLGSTSLRFKDVAISNDIVHLDNAGNARTLYDRSENLFGNAGTNFYGYSIYLGGTGDANRLEDYEEGTFSPAFSGVSGSPSGVNYSQRHGSYTKTGRSVTCHINLALTSWSSAPSGDMIISALPFTCRNNSDSYAGISLGYSDGFTSSDAPQGGYVRTNTTQIEFRTNQSNDARDDLRTPPNAGNMSGDEVVIVTCTYNVD